MPVPAAGPRALAGAHDVVSRIFGRPYDALLPDDVGWPLTPALAVGDRPTDLDDGDIHPVQPSAPDRVDRWVRASSHAAERPGRVFTTVFAHGASSLADAEVVVEPSVDRTVTSLERHYNGGWHYVLHYVTAREAYNLVRAASDGVRGAPQQYLDDVIPSYRAGRAAAAQAARTESPAP